MTRQFRKTVDIKTVDEDERTATGAVLVPDELDHQADFLRPEGVDRFHSDDVDTGVMHAAFPDDAAMLERSEVIDESETIGDEEFPPGTWVATRRYEDDELWQLVQDGVLTGFSIGGNIEDATDHDSVPEDVRVPDAVPDDVAEGEVTELIDGSVTEVSDVDLPAVPRATYKGRDLGKSILEDVDGKEEFVAVMTQERGHDEDDAERLYEYLTDVRDGEKNRDTEKPFTGPDGQEFEDFDDCVATVEDWDGIDDPEAACGRWQSESKVDVNGTEVDLTPPVEVVDAVSAAFDAKEEYSDVLGGCGTGRGEQRGEQILAADLAVEDFVSDDNGTPIPAYHDSHEEDLPGTDEHPSEWDEETWTDGCGPVQAVLWGLVGDGTGKEWSMTTANEIHRARDEDVPYPEIENEMTEPSNDDGGGQTDKHGSGQPDADEPDDATKWRRFKSWLTGSDDGEKSSEALDGADDPGAGVSGSDVSKLEKELTDEQTDIVADLVADFVDAHGDATVGEFRSWFWEMDWAGELDPDEIVALSSAFEDWFEQMAADAQIVTEDFADWLNEQGDVDIELSNNASAGDTAGDTMTDGDTDKSADAPEWAETLTEKVEQIDKRVSEIEGDDADDAEKSLEDAPEWAADLAEKVDDLDERVETISKQSGHSQQLGKGADEEAEKDNGGFTLDPRKAKGGR